MSRGVMIAGTSSGSGKTTVTIGLLEVLSKRYKVTCFKVGPDYIDPSYHKFISKNKSYNLDIFMQGRENLKSLYKTKACQGDIAIIEGVMGLFDGIKTTDFASSAHVARELDVPVILILNAGGMSKSASAQVKGYKDFDPRVNVAGVILNQVGGESHYKLLKNIIEKDTNTKVLGFLPKDENLSLPEENLGLISPTELENFKNTIEKLSKYTEKFIDIDALIRIAKKIDGCKVCNKVSESRVKIGVARDKAFNFYYEAGLETLEKFGAELVYFSPLKDDSLPSVHGIYFGGGPIESFARELSENKGMLKQINKKAQLGMPIFAEGGGMVYLCRSLSLNGLNFPFTKIFDTDVLLSKRMTRFGYVKVKFQEDNILGKKGNIISGHQFSYFDIDTPPKPQFITARPGLDYDKTCGYEYKNCLGTLVYLDFYSDSLLAKNFIKSCLKYKNEVF